jgi:Protein of unknown function (DUF4236)
MGWRFRKIFTLGRARFSLTRRGIGTSFRLPGFRVGRNAQGRLYISFSIPGTGLYWIKQF